MSDPFVPPIPFDTSQREPKVPIEPPVPESPDFTAGTRTGRWFAVGDASEHLVVPSMPPPSFPQATQLSAERRNAIRVVMMVTMVGTLFILGALAFDGTARRALLGWLGSMPALLTIVVVTALAMTTQVRARRRQR